MRSIFNNTENIQMNDSIRIWPILTLIVAVIVISAIIMYFIINI